ncbi:pilus assembly PilX family protein [Methylophaga sp.]|uniref:pilus assembly PilX family protein n=1 Tax=Methylophaga sp. TaxID=2024840 RepID=UPI003F69827C
MLNHTSHYHQKGAAVIVTAILLLIGVTLVVTFAAQVGLQDQRISANQYRHKQAFANAEAGLDFTASFLRQNKSLHGGGVGWTTCAGNTTVFPCDISGAESVYGTISGGAVTSSVPMLAGLEGYMVKVGDVTTVLGVGTSDDGSANSVVQVSYAANQLIVPGQLPPLMIPSGTLSGNFNIVPNPNGAGEGVPVSVWAKDTAVVTGGGTGNWKTCDHDQFRDGGAVCQDTKGDGVTGANWLSCQCNDERSNKNDLNEDIVLYPAADFPSSPFFYVFGDTQVNVKSAAGLVLPNCSSLATGFAGLSGSALVWVEGDCTINGAEIGSRDKPIVLVVEGEIRVNANSEVWGILFGLGDFVLNGGPVIHGSAISELPSDLTNGNYAQVYDPEVFANLKDPEINTIFSRLQYSWRDF